MKFKHFSEQTTMSHLEYSIPISQHGEFAPSLSDAHSDRFMPSDSARNLQQAAPIASTHLLKGHKTVQIQHNGFLYTLQATKLGKLILTK
jgi:hemin uptake protein HemP